MDVWHPPNYKQWMSGIPGRARVGQRRGIFQINSGPRDVASSSGSVLDHVVYDSFGNVLTETNASNGDRFKICGDGIRFYGEVLSGRAPAGYGSSIGRFSSLDPLELRAGDTNLFRYVTNGPTNAFDPSGEGGNLLLGRGQSQNVQIPGSGNGTFLSDLIPMQGQNPGGPRLGNSLGSLGDAYQNADGSWSFGQENLNGLNVGISPHPTNPFGDDDGDGILNMWEDDDEDGIPNALEDDDHDGIENLLDMDYGEDFPFGPDVPVAPGSGLLGPRC